MVSKKICTFLINSYSLSYKDGGSGSDFSRFSSSKAISSDDYFGRTPKRGLHFYN